MRRLRTWAIFVLAIGLIPSMLRAGLYSSNYLDFSRNSFERMLPKNVERSAYPAGPAIDYLNSLGKPTRVFTFRQADIAGYGNKNISWVDNFDPRAFDFINAEDSQTLLKLLQDNRIDYVLVPDYHWPTIYNTAFWELLSNLAYARPMIAKVGRDDAVSRRLQLYKITSTLDQEKQIYSSCANLDKQNFEMVEEVQGAWSVIKGVWWGVPYEISPQKQFSSKLTQTRPKFSNSNNYLVAKLPPSLLVSDKNRVLSISGEIQGSGLYTFKIQANYDTKVYRNLATSSKVAFVSQTASIQQKPIGSFGGSIPIEGQWKDINLVLESSSNSFEELKSVRVKVCSSGTKFIVMSEDVVAPKIDLKCPPTSCASEIRLTVIDEKCWFACSYQVDYSNDLHSDFKNDFFITMRDGFCRIFCGPFLSRMDTIPDWAIQDLNDFNFIGYTVECLSECGSNYAEIGVQWQDSNGSKHLFTFPSPTKDNSVKIFIPTDTFRASSWEYSVVSMGGKPSNVILRMENGVSR